MNLWLRGAARSVTGGPPSPAAVRTELRPRRGLGLRHPLRANALALPWTLGARPGP